MQLLVAYTALEPGTRRLVAADQPDKVLDLPNDRKAADVAQVLTPLVLDEDARQGRIRGRPLDPGLGQASQRLASCHSTYVGCLSAIADAPVGPTPHYDSAPPHLHYVGLGPVMSSIVDPKNWSPARTWTRRQTR